MLKMLRTNCKTNNLDAQVNIVKRLEKLNKWQEEQKRLLDERQNMQRKMLGLEHQDVYEKMGFIPDNDIIDNVENGGGDTSVDQIKICRGQNNYGSDSEIKEIESRLFLSRNRSQEEFSNQINYNDIVYSNGELEVKDVKPKRPYLKRGDGIKARYKISPESLRLNNLPRYKFAATHSKIKYLQRRRMAPKLKPSQKNSMIEIKAGDCIDEINHDANEKQFHKMFAKANPANSSTPDTKTSKAAPSSISITLPNVRLGKTECKETKDFEDFEESRLEQQVDPYVAVTWSKVLDPQNLKPIPIQDIRRNVSSSERSNHNDSIDDENLSIFELLERQADQGTIDMNSSCVRKLLSNKIKNDKNDSNYTERPINKRYADCRLRPAVEEVLRCDSDDENSFSEVKDIKGEEISRAGIITYVSSESKNESTLNADKIDLHVRFSEENTTCEYETCGDIISNNSMLDEDTSSHKSSYLFHQFKDALFSALLGKDAGEDKTSQKMLISSPPSTLTQELQEKSNIIKLRLEELEKEIAAFRNNNVELLRAKQEYEMERAHFNQERSEALDRLKDDKIQMEMYLHDERMKIEEDRRKFEHQMRVQKQVMTNKERKEIARLKDELETLQIQLKQKEQLHASAQARLRVQLRNMERDQKQLYEDIERLTKENKRLQNEKQKLEREGSNKMLMEINRNIAKLAPKLTTGNTCNNSEYQDLNNKSCMKNSKALHSSPTQKPNGKYNRLMKAPPNTRNTSRTNLIDDSENSGVLYKLDIDERCNDSEGDLADDDDDDIISELKQAQNCKSVKSVESTSHSNTSKDTVIYNCDLNKGTDRPNVKLHSMDIKMVGNGKRISKCGSEPEENFRREIINPDGSKDILYPNGNLKKISSDGMNIRMLYFNKDIKETNVNEGTVKYYYAETNTWHTTYLDGLEILEFPNGQTEHRYKNGVIEIHLPDNSVKITNPAEKDKLEEWRFADGTNLIQMRNGDKVLMLPNGQKEIHTKLNKRREYPDGTVKLVYPDGSQETRYSNGRVRLKDKEGNLVMDTERI